MPTKENPQFHQRTTPAFRHVQPANGTSLTSSEHRRPSTGAQSSGSQTDRNSGMGTPTSQHSTATPNGLHYNYNVTFPGQGPPGQPSPTIHQHPTQPWSQSQPPVPMPPQWTGPTPPPSTSSSSSSSSSSSAVLPPRGVPIAQPEATYAHGQQVPIHYQHLHPSTSQLAPPPPPPNASSQNSSPTVTQAYHNPNPNPNPISHTSANAHRARAGVTHAAVSSGSQDVRNPQPPQHRYDGNVPSQTQSLSSPSLSSSTSSVHGHLAGAAMVSNDARSQQQHASQAQFAPQQQPTGDQQNFQAFIKMQQLMQEQGKIPPAPAPYSAPAHQESVHKQQQPQPHFSIADQRELEALLKMQCEDAQRRGKIPLVPAPYPAHQAAQPGSGQAPRYAPLPQGGGQPHPGYSSQGARIPTGGAPPSPASSAGASQLAYGRSQSPPYSSQPLASQPSSSQPSFVQGALQQQPQSYPPQSYPPQPYPPASRPTTASQSQPYPLSSWHTAPQAQPPSSRPTTTPQSDLRSPVPGPGSNHAPPPPTNSSISEGQRQTRENKSTYPTPTPAQLSAASFGSTRNTDPHSKNSPAQQAQPAQQASSSLAIVPSRTPSMSSSSTPMPVIDVDALPSPSATRSSIPDLPLPCAQEDPTTALLHRFRSLIEPMDNMHLNIWHTLMQRVESTVVEVYQQGEQRVKLERARREAEVRMVEERLRGELGKVEERYREEVGKAEERVKEEQARAEGWKKKLDDVQVKAFRVVKTMQERFLAVQRECSEAKEELEKCRAERDCVAQERDSALAQVHDVQGTLAKLTEELGNLKKEKRAWEEERDKMRAEGQFVGHLRTVNAFLSKELDTVKSSEGTKEDVVAKMRETVDGLYKDLEAEWERRDVAERRVGELEVKHVEAEKRVQELEIEREKRVEAERRVKELEGEKEKRLEAERRVKELEAEKEKRADSKRIVMDLQEIIATMKSSSTSQTPYPTPHTPTPPIIQQPCPPGAPSVPSPSTPVSICSTPLPPQPEVLRRYSFSGPPPKPIRTIIPESSPITRRAMLVVDEEQDVRGQLSLRTPPPERIVVRKDGEGTTERMVEDVAVPPSQIASSARLSRPIEPHPMDRSSPLYNPPTPSTCYSSALALSASLEEEDIVDTSSSRSSSPDLQRIPPLVSLPENSPPPTPSVPSSSLPPSISATVRCTPARSRASTPIPSSSSRTQPPTPTQSYSAIPSLRPRTPTPSPSSSSRTQPPTPTSAIPAKLKRKRDNEESPRKEVTPAASPAVHKRQRYVEESPRKETTPAASPAGLKRKRDGEEEHLRRQVTGNPIPVVKGGIRAKRKKPPTMFIPKKPMAWKGGPPPKRPQQKTVEVGEVGDDEVAGTDVPMLPPPDDSSEEGAIDEEPVGTSVGSLRDETEPLFTPERSVEDGEIVEEDVKDVKMEPEQDEDTSDLVDFNAGIERMDLLYKMNPRTGGISCRVCCHTPGHAITHFAPGVTWKQALEHCVKQHPGICRELKMMDRQKVVENKILLGVTRVDGSVIQSVVEVLQV